MERQVVLPGGNGILSLCSDCSSTSSGRSNKERIVSSVGTRRAHRSRITEVTLPRRRQSLCPGRDTLFPEDRLHARGVEVRTHITLDVRHIVPVEQLADREFAGLGGSC